MGAWRCQRLYLRRCRCSWGTTRPLRTRAGCTVARAGTLRRECLDHVIPLNEAHLRTILAEYAAYCNTERPHRTLRLKTPRPAARSPTGPVVARPVLGGLHHAYARAA